MTRGRVIYDFYKIFMLTNLHLKTLKLLQLVFQTFLSLLNLNYQLHFHQNP